MKEVGGYLPPCLEGVLEYKTHIFQRNQDTVEIQIPLLTRDQMDALTEIVKRNSRFILKSFTINEIVNIIDKSIAIFLDRSSKYRQKAEKLLPIITGYDEEIIRLGLTSYLKSFRKPQLQRFLVEDLGNPLLLDDFQPRPKGGFSKAMGPELVAHVWAGNVPALPIWSLISGLLIKAGNIGKVSSGEPLFAGLFAQVLVEIEPKLADCLAIVWWKGGDEERESCLLNKADVVVGYGSNTSLASLGTKIPLTTRFLPFGHKISFGIISRASLDSRKAWQTAHSAALDVVRYDQQGCYSPHCFYVQRGGSVSPREFARYMAHELECFEKRYPRRGLSLEEITANAAWRHKEELNIFSNSSKEVLGTTSNNWTVVYEEAGQEINPSCLNRAVKVIAVDQLEQVIDYIKPYRSLLQTVGIASTPKELFDISDLLGRAGVTRLTGLGSMTSPEAGWHHDGRFNLLDLINMVDIECSAEVYAEKFAPYVD
ncbi:acyl-CoA reductase [Desulfosporosinus lacus]|uniref:Acyl-CoA reductase n=1 Tax=Desulfosporosinus lacus DSM 15449 TaxID=1121420 RepID=A0A1M5RL29_9FIRM|nr:acyl-CoA reductase [Desulfosporosinus lacus]SHH26900.1 Acyl-CoA reductase (LuxC) [Desulfosporosinus lacus DSM 15449]